MKTITRPAINYAAVWRRDRGVCAACGLDTEWLADLLDGRDEAMAPKPYTIRWWCRDLADGALWWLTAPEEIRRALGFRPKGRMWDADHIVGLHLADDQQAARKLNRLDNLQTLCTPCHTEKTGGQATDRAKLERIRQKAPNKDAWAGLL